MEDMVIHCLGRYGERIAFKHLQEGEYQVSCEELGIKEAVMTKKDFEEFEKRYLEDGVPDFDKSDLAAKKKRAVEMGKRLQRYYRRFQQYSHLPDNLPFECLWYAIDVYRIMMDVKVLELSDEQYEEWFVRAGWRGHSKETEEYVQFALNVKKYITDKHQQ